MLAPRRTGLILVLALSVPARARDLWTDGESGVSLRTSLKGAALVQRAPDAPLLFPEREAASSLWRLRLDAGAHAGARASFALAYEQRLRIEPAGTPVAGAVLGGDAPPPYRLEPLDWPLSRGRAWAWRHEIDRASAALRLGRVALTAGRQVVGWGRGAFFAAVDLFAPFSPLEVDREWRRGVDALRAEVRLSDRTSAEAVCALGPSARSSVVAARVRGHAGPVDAELVAGRRATDLVVGATSSAAIGDAEVHGELAVFRAEEPLPAGGAWGDTRLAPKLVLGASGRLAVGRGLLVLAEYHYSALGVRRPADAVPLLLDPAFAARLARGDLQLIGRHGAALLASIELANELAVELLVLASPRDGSGVAAPSATWTLSDAASVHAVLNLPWGAAPDGLSLRSDLGATPVSGVVQLRVYD